MDFPKSASDALVAILKQFESETDQFVSPTDHFVVRIDGVAFHTFLKGVHHPFDARVTDAMVATTIDLMQRFNAITGYTQSDEISLVFPAVEVPEDSPLNEMLLSETAKKKRKRREDVNMAGSSDSLMTDTAIPTTPPATKTAAEATKSAAAEPPKRVHMYNGRMQKIASVTASYAAARFNYHLYDNPTKWDSPALPAHVRSRMLSHEAYFDARVIPLTDMKTAMESIFWRSNFDGLRNAISHIAQHHFPKRALHGKSVRTQIEMLQTEKNVMVMRDWGERFIFGTWIKREQFLLVGAMNPKTGVAAPEPAVRSRMRCGSFNWADWTEDERVLFTMSKFWPEGERAPPKGLATVTVPGSVSSESAVAAASSSTDSDTK
eukprot:jgi/Hompol1/830/HPOL_002578-RA